MKPTLDQVIIKEEKGIGCDTRFVVTPVWKGVDRPITDSMSCGRSRRLAERLSHAILVGAVCANPEVKTDVNGRTYVACVWRVMGRHLNADLKRLGF